MKRLYYEIWADAIEAADKSESYMTHKDKMFVLLAGFSIAQGFNLGLVFLALSNFIKTPFFLQIDLFSGTMLDGALAGIITLFLPFAILNYILIFKKKGYKKFVENRRIKTKGKALLIYFACSSGLFLLVVITGKLVL